jgi:molecular chaperone GrpE (heat shock protein)
MARPEEYRERAKRARQDAKACRDEWERERLITIADQLERIAEYKELTSVRPDDPSLSS